MNERTDRLLKALGDIGEDLIEKAAPVYSADSEAGEIIKTAVPTVYEPEVKITKKDLRIYWITRALGMAAVAALIVGAVVLLVQNWDKIAVSGNDRPGTVTSAAEPMESNESIVTLPPPLDYDSMSKEEKFAAQLLNGLRWRMNSAEVQLAASEYWGRTEPSRIHREDSDVLQEYYNVISYDDVEFYGGKANIALVVFDNAGLKSIEYQVRYDVSDDGAKSADEMYERIRTDFINVLGEPDYPDLNWWDFAESKLHFDVYKADNWIVEVQLDDTSDLYGEITDTAMPEPYDDEYVRHIDFTAQWESRFYTFEPMIPQEKREKYYELMQDPSVETPYTITDNWNIMSCIRRLELDWNDTKEFLRSSQVFSDEDIQVIYNAIILSDGSAVSALIEHYRSPYAVVGDFNGNGYRVFSPMWLYYHTIGDYKAMGVPAKSVEEMIPLYASKLGLRDEAWEQFRNKLYRYISSENNEPETTTSSVTMPDSTTAEAVTTTAEVSEITEEIADTFTFGRPAGSWFELEETLYRIDNTAPFDCVTFNDDGTCSSIFIDEWKEEYDAIGYTSELENIRPDNYVGAYDNYGIDIKMLENADPNGYVKRLYSTDYKNSDKGEALAMRNKYIVSQLNETQLKNIDKYMRDKLAVPYESIEWNNVYGVYYVETNNRCELMPDRYYSAVDEDTRHELFEAMYEADRISEIDGNPGSTYYHTNPLPIAGADEYIGFWTSGSYNAKIIAAYIIGKDSEGQYRAEMKTDITDELDRLYIDGAKLMFVKSGGGYYAVTESDRKIGLIPGDEGAVPNYEAKFAYRVRPYLPLPDGAVEDIKLGDEQKEFLIKEAYESAQSFERDIPSDRLAVSDPVKISEQQFFVFVFDGDEIVGKIICYSDEGFSGSASGFNTGNYDKAVDGLTKLYKSGEKVSFTWFGGNLYCCQENAASYPIECAVFHKPSYVYLYDAEYGAPIHRNNAE